MTGVFFSILLIITGLAWRFKQHKQAKGDFTQGWLARELPQHEHEQAKRS